MIRGGDKKCCASLGRGLPRLETFPGSAVRSLASIGMEIPNEHRKKTDTIFTEGIE